ncbi:MAG: M48 family metallopeptidase [Rickettsiales bacterium]|jgi:heat shock protein HtpX|nr:M48 family metallopeptidase [Rickettsiales bacterium]
MATVYEHIKSNNRKTMLLLALFPTVLIALIFLIVFVALSFAAEPGQSAIGGALSVAVSVAIPVAGTALIWMLISWAFGDSMMLSVAGARQIHEDEKEYRPLFQAVQNVALAAGLPMPKVYIIDDDGMNAFATGRAPTDASVAFTRGIVRTLDRAELEGVIAHEMAHVGNRDIRMDVLIITGLGCTIFIADIILRMAFSGGGSNGKNKGQAQAVLLMVWCAFVLFNFVIAPILHMAVSRKREYLADATGAFITRNPRALASALSKISGNPRVRPVDGNRAMARAFIADPRKNFSGLFATHPPIEERVKRLNDM